MLRLHHDFADIDTATIIAYPGAGKGTVIGAMKRSFHQHGMLPEPSVFEVGQMVRNAIDLDEPLGRLAIEYSSKGRLVPDDVIVPEIRNALRRLHPNAFWFLDGFPRREEQIDPYEEAMAEAGRIDTGLHLSLGDDPKIAREIAEERMVKRGEHTQRKGLKPRRDDIDPIARNKRLDEAALTHPVVDHFKRYNKLITIDAVQSIDKVEAAVRDSFFATIRARRSA